MATVGNRVMTLEDHAKAYDESGKLSMIVEMLSQENAILEDMPFREGNLTTGHRTTIRTGLPEVYWRGYNEGVPSSKSKRATVDEKCGMLEAYAECDVRLAELEGSEKAYRMSEARAFVEALGQELASTYFYGNAGLNPKEITGLATRYGDLSAENGENIIDAGGTGTDNASIWLLGFGEESIHGIFPRGTQAGIKHTDLGEVTRELGDGLGSSMLQVYRDHFTVDTGIVVKDWRQGVRISNIDVSNLDAGTGAELIELMIKALYRINQKNKGRLCFYMNRTVMQYLDVQRFNTVASAGMEYKEVDGKPVNSFRGYEVKVVDALLNTEERVV